MNVSHYASRLLRRSGAGRTIGSGLGGGPSPPGIDYSLSDGDIQKLLPGVKIIAYPDLANYSRIEDALDEQGRVVILFETESKTVGHWIALHATPDGGIEFFDSYGLRPDSQKRWLSKSKLVELKEDEPLLMDLLRDSEARGKPVTFNATHFQSDRDNVQTCGRHCVVRLMSKGSSLPNYTTWLKSQPGTPDDVVTRITNTHLGRSTGDRLCGSGNDKDEKEQELEADKIAAQQAADQSPLERTKAWDRYVESTRLQRLAAAQAAAGQSRDVAEALLERQRDLIGSSEYLSVLANQRRILGGGPIPKQITVQGHVIPVRVLDPRQMEELNLKLRLPLLHHADKELVAYMLNNLKNAAFIMIVFDEYPTFTLKAIKVISKSPHEPQTTETSPSFPKDTWDISGGLIVFQQKTGLGSRLMDAVKGLAHAYHVTAVAIESLPEAHGFYRKQDMKPLIRPGEDEAKAIADLHLMGRVTGIKRERGEYTGLGRLRKYKKN